MAPWLGGSAALLRRFALRLDQHTARDLDPLGIDPTILLGKQRRYHRADVIWQTSTPEGGHVRNTLVQVWIVANDAAAEIGGDGTRSDGVDGDPPRPRLLGQAAGENLDRALHRGIGGAWRDGDARKARRDSHDPATVVDQRKELLRQEEHALEVDIIEAVQFCLGRLLEGVVM